MPQATLIKKIEKAGLLGRGGGCYPTAQKWLAVKAAADSLPKGKRICYVVANGSEGEPGVGKDRYLLKNHAGQIAAGLILAIDFLEAEKAFLYLNPEYYKELYPSLKKAFHHPKLVIYRKPHKAGYIGGEETSALNTIEGKRTEPRLRPPYPPQSGLFGYPTLINNIETFYHICLINEGRYERKRFYTLNGDCLWTGVYEFPENWTVERILKETDNYPSFDFFVQIGGDASGDVRGMHQLKTPVTGSASITIYSTIKHDPVQLIKKWFRFFMEESCGQCTPCREGTYRLFELINDKEPDWKMIGRITRSLKETSFCGLGCAAPIAVSSYIKNVLSRSGDLDLKISRAKRQLICECF